MPRPKIKTLNFVLSKKYDGFMGRCYRKKDPSYKNYGAKGIRVCSEWIKDIEAFRNWAKAKIQELNIEESDFITNSKKFHLDRINGYKHYSPDNCTFSSPMENGRNKTNRVKRIVISAEGEEILV
jgi:hypothetical protein